MKRRWDSELNNDKLFNACVEVEEFSKMSRESDERGKDKTGIRSSRGQWKSISRREWLTVKCCWDVKFMNFIEDSSISFFNAAVGKDTRFYIFVWVIGLVMDCKIKSFSVKERKWREWALKGLGGSRNVFINGGDTSRV